MGNKGSHEVSGAKGSGPHLLKALGELSDHELVEQMDEVAASPAQEKAQVIAPDMIDVLEEVASMSRSDPARVAAAREILNQAHGRPESRIASKDRQGAQITIEVLNFQMDGTTRVGQEIVVEAVEELVPVPAGPITVEVDEF